jgi:RNA polymerase sigma-70 factor (ECF subfamily)
MMKEEQTILLAREGSMDAFHQLYQNHWERIWRMALRYSGSKNDAEDIMQETFINAYRKIHTYKFHLSSSFASWLNTICLNCTIDFLRRRKSKQINKHISLNDLIYEPASSNPSPYQITEEKQAEKKIQECLQILSPRQRVIFDMRFNQHMDIRDIAEYLQCSTSNVKTQIFRSLQKLRKILIPIWGKQ